LEINNAKLGLKKTGNNLPLIIVNAFVGGMIGMGTIIPKFAEIEFGIASKQPFFFYSRLWNYQSS
jgi:hypothetical protein